MEKLKVIFIGTDGIGTPLLRKLAEGFFDVPLVVTGPDRPAGRKLQLQPSPIKLAAEELGLEVFQPININAEMSIARLANLNPDMIVTMAYGQILSRDVLNIPKIDCLNVHASLLPKYRGASPIQSAILNQDETTGISLMKMARKMDAGPVYEQFEIKIAKNDTGESLFKKLAELAADEIPKALQLIAADDLITHDQDENQATYCHKIKKADGQIDWNQSAKQIDAKIRAFSPWPGTFTFFENKRLKILSAEMRSDVNSNDPGLVKKEGIACQDGLIYPLELQLEGRGIQDFESFMRGKPDFVGSVLT